MNWTILIYFLLTGFICKSQEPFLRSNVEGYYEGAVIRGNSVALLTAEFFRKSDSLFVHSNVKEWTYYPGLTSLVDVQKGVYRFDTYYGNATMLFDSAYTELIGSISSGTPGTQVHLKKVRRPPGAEVETSELTIDVGDIELDARLHLPKGYQRPLACAIYVHGRGCSQMERPGGKATILAQYGIATLTFDKRGAEGTGFACNRTTIDMHTNDLVRIIEHAAELKEIDKGRIGLIGGSYGGWVAPRAAATSRVKVAFIISLVGPSTSIQRQQLDNAIYYTEQRLNGDEEIIRQIQEYMLLQYETGDDKETFRKLNVLLKQAEENNWIGILEETDIATTPEDIQYLWVRRNRYDPAEDLKQFKGPFLSILGEKDNVVPWQENAERFESIFEAAGKRNHRIVVLPEAPHWLEHGHILRDLGYSEQLQSNNFYFKFDRVAPGVMEEMILFLREYGYIP